MRDEYDLQDGKPNPYLDKLPIDRFTGDFRFLSNFAEAPITWDGETWRTTEHAFQAAKAESFLDRAAIRAAGSPGAAKKLGKTVKLRPDWEQVKVGIMLDLLRLKFAPGTEMATKLLATGARPLVEGNDWGDRFWGVCEGRGENKLGQLLMQVRHELSTSEAT